MTVELAVLIVAVLGGALQLPGLLGQCFVYTWLGVFPGLALANALVPREPAALRWTLGLALAPLVTTAAAWCLMTAGLSLVSTAFVVAAAGWVGTGLGLTRLQPGDSRVPRGAILWGLGLGAVLILVPVLNPYLFIRGDSWIHGGIVMEIFTRGFPPEDPRMAGVHLNYVWFFNFFIALLHGIQRQDIFRFMTLFNGANAFATVLLAALAARRLWGSDRAALAAAVLLTFGLNAGAFVLWPLHLVRAFTGEVTGMSEVVRRWHGVEWNTARIIYSLSAPFAEMASFLDKLLVGTALNFAYLQMALWMWALLEWLDGRKRVYLLWLASGAAGMMFFHSVVGLSVIPIGLTLLGLAWLLAARWPWLPPRPALVAAAAATFAGFLVTVPYLRSITAGWAPERAGFHFSFLHFNGTLPWTVATACGFVIAWMIEPLQRSWKEQRALPLLVGGWAALMALFSFVVQLPQHNEIKFVYECFTACVLVAAPGVLREVANARRRPKRAALILALAIVPTLLTLHGYLVDRTGRTREELHPVPGEHDLYHWLAEETPRGAVVVDRDFRDLVAVKAARRLYLGTDQPPELAAFPAPEMRRRRETMRDLYGPLAAPDTTLGRLEGVGQPVYVIYRPNDRPAVPEPWKRVLAASTRADLVYDLGGFHVVRILPREGS